MNITYLIKRSEIILSIFLFFLIFNPPIYKGFSFTKTFLFLATIYIIMHYRKTKTIIQKSHLNKIIPIFLISVYYYSIVILVNLLISLDVSVASYFLSLFEYLFYYFLLLIVILSINLFCVNYDLKTDNLIFCFIIAGSLQTLIVLACYSTPFIRTFFLNLIMNNSNSERISSIVYLNFNTRNYGWASSLYDIFGYSSAILVLLAFVTGLYKKFIYVIVAFIMIAMPLFNARTGLLFVIISLIYVLMVYIKTMTCAFTCNKFYKFVLALILAFFAYYVIYVKILSDGSDSSNWIISGIEETILFFSGYGLTSDGYYDAIINNSLFLPSFLKTIFGTGVTPMVSIGKNTDVGFVQNIWKFGIIGSIFIYYLNYRVFKLAYKYSKNSFGKTMSIVMAIMFFMYLIKLNPLGYTQAAVITFPILFKIIYDNNSIVIVKN